DLPKVEEVYEDFLRQMRKASPGPIIMVSPGETRREKPFPAVRQWVDGGYGHIEIGDREVFGFVARALDYGGLVFEDDKPRSLAEALAALDKGLAAWFKEQGIEVGEHRASSG